jgi:hypothetical protein
MEYSVMVNRLGPKKQFELTAKQTEWTGLVQSSDPIDELNLPHGVKLCKTGIVLPDELTLDEWEEVGTKLMTIDRGIQWALADWWAYGHHRYGERAYIAKTFPYDFGSLMNLGSVARRVTPSFRNEAVSFTHHVVVAPLEPERQKQLLKMAARNKWSVSKLRDMLHENSDPPDDDQKSIRWAESFLTQARRAQPTRLSDPWEPARLDRVSDHLLANLVEAVTVAAATWTEIAEGFKQYQQTRRVAAGTSSRPRLLKRPDRPQVQQAAG